MEHLPSTGVPIIDAALLILIGGVGSWALFRDKYIKMLRKRIDECEAMLADTLKKLASMEEEWRVTREANHKLRGEIHAKDLQLVELREHTNFEPVRDLLATMVHAQSATNTQVSTLAQHMERITVGVEMMSVKMDAFPSQLQHSLERAIEKELPKLIKTHEK